MGSVTTKSQKWHYKMTPRAPNFVYNNQFWAPTKCILMYQLDVEPMGLGPLQNAFSCFSLDVEPASNRPANFSPPERAAPSCHMTPIASPTKATTHNRVVAVQCCHRGAYYATRKNGPLKQQFKSSHKITKNL